MARDCPASVALELHPRHLCGGGGLGRRAAAGAGGGDDDEEDEEDEEEEGPLSVAQLDALEQLHLAALRRVARARAEAELKREEAARVARDEHRRQVDELLNRAAGRREQRGRGSSLDAQ